MNSVISLLNIMSTLYGLTIKYIIRKNKTTGIQSRTEIVERERFKIQLGNLKNQLTLFGNTILFLRVTVKFLLMIIKY